MKKTRIPRWMFWALGMALSGWMASCGGGTFCHAQGAWTQLAGVGTSYSPDRNLESLDTLALGAAVKTVDLAAFSLTDAAIVDTLKADAARGVKIRIYLDRGELQSECRGDPTCARIPLHLLLDLPGVTVKVKFSKVLMHLKSYEIDGQLVRDGSANFSEQGENRQDNSAVFSGDRESLARFETKFEKMWARGDNLTVAEGIKAK